jgi:CheY-like chemotaxis protein
MQIERTKRILLVEDEATIRQAIRDTLAGEDFSITEATNGAEGLTLALLKHPDLIILDVLMPKMHGIEMYSALRSDQWGKTAQVMFLTSYTEDPRLKQFADDPRCTVVNKTKARLEDIAEHIKKIFSSAQS